MQIEAYKERLNYKSELKADLSTLKLLQKSHLLNIPFENLDIHNNTPIVLDIEKIYDKVIQNQRGGFCYELNGSFYEFLKLIGFEVRRISARVYNNNKYGAEFDHLVLLVKIDSVEYLVDVGFGDFILEPLEFVLDKKQEDHHGVFVFDKYDDTTFRVSQITSDGFLPKYIFQDIERNFEDFEGMCHFHQTSPDSFFTMKRLISIPKENGRITISGNELIIKENGIERKESFEESEFGNLLVRHFNFKN